MENNLIYFGGSFNPIHLGHIHIAKEASKLFNSKIVFIPNYISPLKTFNISNSHKLEMLNIAINEYKNFSIDTREINKTESSYAYYTFLSLGATETNRIKFLVGSDSILTLDQWYRYEDLIKITDFIVFKRPNKEINFEKISKNISINYLEINGLDISSTEIRKKIKNKEKTDNLLNPLVEKYIIENNLYL